MMRHLRTLNGTVLAKFSVMQSPDYIYKRAKMIEDKND